MKISMKTRSIGYTYGSTSGVYSFRNEKSIRHESLLEKEFIQLMDFNDNVIDIIGQPVIEYISKEGKKENIQLISWFSLKNQNLKNISLNHFL